MGFAADAALKVRCLRSVQMSHNIVNVEAGLRGTARWYREQGWL